MFRRSLIGSLVALGIAGSAFPLSGAARTASTSVSAAAPTGSAPSFAPAKSYATRAGSSIAIGDLNRDGKLDVAATSSGTVSVLLNRGDGSFANSREYGTARSSISLAIGDLNGDGNTDLVTANLAGTVSVLLNRGDGSFEGERDYAAGEDPLSVAIGDLNGDAKLDLVTVSSTSFGAKGWVSVLVNRGDGSFEARRVYRTGPAPRSVAIADLNGDGKPELATANPGGLGTVSVLVNRGDGSFAARRDYTTSYGPFWVGIGDLNGDGKPDLVSVGMRIAHLDKPTVSVLLNRGDGRFQARRDFRAGSFPNSASYTASSVALGDLNGDAKPDLALACCDKAVVSVLTERDGARFRRKLEYRSGRRVGYDRASAVSIGDLDGDGKLDLAVANDYSGTVSVLINTPGLCTVQAVTRLALPAAKSTLARANCRVGRVRRAYSRARRGRVISQRPRFGAVLPGGSKVSLVISRGRS
jgi:hypothetical protein